MSGEALEKMADGVSEEEMARLPRGGRRRTFDPAEGADLLECAGDAVGIARELDGRSVGQILALAATAALIRLPKNTPT